MTRVCLPFGFCACHKKRRQEKASWKSNFFPGFWGVGATNMRSSVMNAFEMAREALGQIQLGVEVNWLKMAKVQWVPLRKWELIGGTRH